MHTIPSHITPKNPADRQRWREQALRLRLLEGDFEDDVRDDIRRLFAAEIAYDLELAPDTSRNTFLLVNQQLSTAYLKPPSISIGEEDENDLSEVVTPRLWPVQRLNELRVRALNESVIKVGWSTDGEASYQVIDPSTLVVTAHPDYPDRPARVEWLRPREDGKVWTWETWDSIEGIFRIEKVRDNGTREDVTEQYAPGLEGRYPYEDAEGFVLPFVLYHASAASSRLWSPYNGSELVRGTLRGCSLWSNWQDGFVNAAHPQRYALDADSQAGVTRSIGGVSVDIVPTDRKSILKFSSTGATGASLSQFAPSMEPRSAAEALTTYESGLAIYAGLNPSDLQTSGAQSGYAIVVSREGQKRKAEEIAPALRLGDQTLLSTAARIVALFGVATLPTAPREWVVKYNGLGESPLERKSKAEGVKLELELGLLSQVEAVRRLNPELQTDAAAVDRLLSIRKMDEILTPTTQPSPEVSDVERSE